MPFLHSSVLGPSKLASRLQAGSAALFPTDTLPALGALPQYAKQLWAIKRRPLDKPLILMAASADELFEWASPYALKDAWYMARRYWPGQLTLVIPAFGDVVDALNPGVSTIGMRVPACELTKHLLSLSGPLATTSANLAGSASSLSADEAAECFPRLPLLGPMPWPKASGQASTLLEWQAAGRWKLLRRGALIPEIGES